MTASHGLCENQPVGRRFNFRNPELGALALSSRRDLTFNAAWPLVALVRVRVAPVKCVGVLTHSLLKPAHCLSRDDYFSRWGGMIVVDHNCQSHAALQGAFMRGDWPAS